MDSTRHILIAVDESAASQRAFDWAIENLHKEGDEVHLFHVIAAGQFIVAGTDLGVDAIIGEDPAAQVKVEEHAAAFIQEKYVSRLAPKQIPYKVEVVKFATDRDSVGSIICKRAEQINAVAIVLAKHTRSQISEFFVGSVTNFVTHHAKAPVLVMHCD